VLRNGKGSCAEKEVQFQRPTHSGGEGTYTRGKGEKGGESRISLNKRSIIKIRDLSSWETRGRFRLNEENLALGEGVYVNKNILQHEHRGNPSIPYLPKRHVCIMGGGRRGIKWGIRLPFEEGSVGTS